ncbi:plexin-C1-like [Pagrus major]|uniref:plexin-C1-like n=1 Tax=Pagrus major TaxID=143350 RepID=UPI003CC8D71E
MILLPGLLFILWGEPARCLAEGGGFDFNGDIRQYAVATNTVYIATEETLYQLNHDLTLVRSVTQRGTIKIGERLDEAQFQRVSETDKWNTTFRVNVLLPFVEIDTLISCGVLDRGCGFCELLDLEDISKVLYREPFPVGPQRRNSSASVGFLVNVEKTPTETETYILTAIQAYKEKPDKVNCPLSETVNLHNTNNNQKGGIFSLSGDGQGSIDVKDNVEFVDGFQLGFIIYLFSNLPSSDKSNKVRLIWLEGKISKGQTVKSLRGATLSISEGGEGSRLEASSVIPGGPPVLWSGVFSVDGGRTNTELVLFDISPDLTGGTDKDPFCTKQECTQPKTLKLKKVLFRQNYMTSVLAVRQKAWMIFFIGTGDGQLIKLAVDRNYHTACPRVLYRADDDRKVLPKMHLDPVDLKHVYVPFQNQIKRVAVSNCSTYTNVQDCWSAQDPYCVWCGSKSSCTFEDDCQDSDWLSIPDDSQQKMVSHRVVKDNTGQIKLTIQTHVTVGSEALANFACQFSASSSELCSRDSPPPQFPQCNCILTNSALPAEGMHVTVRIRLGKTYLTEQLKMSNCADIIGPPTSVLCRQCIEAGCGWSVNHCSWANQGERNDNLCQKMDSGMDISRPEISSIIPNVITFYGKNHAVLSGLNLHDVTRVRIQADMDCTPQESPVWSNTGQRLTFHIPSADNKGVVKVCVVLPDGSCHGNAIVTYRSSPSCTDFVPNTSWISGKREITITGSHLDFVEGVVHDHAPQTVRPAKSNNSQNLIYNTPAAPTNGIFISHVSLKVANETLACSPTITYYPDPEFISFTAARTGDDVRITIQKKADKLNMKMTEIKVQGVRDEKKYNCFMENLETSNKTDSFTCEIRKPPDAKFQKLLIVYGGKTVTLTLSPSYVLLFLMLLVLLLIPFIIVLVIIVYRHKQKKLTATMNKYVEDMELTPRRSGI